MSDPPPLHINPQTDDHARDALLQLGYHPAEVLAWRLPLYRHDLAWHLDLVRCEDGVLSNAAPPMETDTARDLFARLEAGLQLPDFGYHACGGSFGVLSYTGGWPFDLKTTDPRTHLGRPEAAGRPKGAGDEVMRELIETSQRVFATTVVVSQAWVWGRLTPGVLRPLNRDVVVTTTSQPAAEAARAAGARVLGA
ncbi:MAG: hypothetical protein ACFCVE_02230 [Phycisphaerae bacterium]